MRGFAGIYKNNINDNDITTVKNMSEIIANRGKEHKTEVYNNKLAITSRFVSTNDENIQPFATPDGKYVVVINGTIYNYPELTKEFLKENHVFKTNNEIEILSALYDNIGTDVFAKLRGMFALLVYDIKNDVIVFARDCFGTKPFYYTKIEGGIAFASEMKALVLTVLKDKKIKPDNKQFQHYLTFQYVPEPNTILNEVKILCTGSYMKLTVSNTLSENKKSENITKLSSVGNENTEFIPCVEFTALMFAPDKTLSYNQKKADIRSAVEESIEKHMISDMRVGSFLSSGIDSAIITALASKINPGIKAFTIAFNEKDYSELDNAIQIAERLDVEHIKLNFTFEDFISEYEKVIYHLDSPVADPSTVAIYILCREVSKHVDIVLSGEGSDEFFGGYKVYNDAPITEKIYNTPFVLRKFLAFLGAILPDFVKGKSRLIRGTTPIEKRYIGNAFIFDEKQKKDIMTQYDPTIHFSQVTQDIYKKVENENHLIKMQYCDINTWVKGDILVKGDRLSMAHGLEIRMPFLDTKVWETAKVLCQQDKLSHGTTKYILRDTFKDILNAETHMRPKWGFPVPVRKWLKNEMYDWARNIITNSNTDEYIIKSAALKLLEDHRKGKADNYRTLWTILAFSSWKDRF